MFLQVNNDDDDDDDDDGYSYTLQLSWLFCTNEYVLRVLAVFSVISLWQTKINIRAVELTR